MKRPEVFLHMKIKPLLKLRAKRAAEREDLTLTQWVNRAISIRLLDGKKQ